MGAKDFFKNQTGLKPDVKGVIKDNLNDYLLNVESSTHVEEKIEEKNYLLPDIDYSEPKNFVRYGLAYEYYNNAFIRIRTQYPYDGSAAEKLAFYNDLTPLEKYIFDQKYPKYNGHVSLGLGSYKGGSPTKFGTTTNPQYIRFYGGPHEGNVINANVGQENNLNLNLHDGFTIEFWLSKRGVANITSETQFESLVNIRNEEDTQRFFLFIDSTLGQNKIQYRQQNYNAGTFETINTGSFNLGFNINSSWTHYAFSFVSESLGIKSVCYANGQEVDTNFYTILAANPIYTITGSVVGTINGAGGSSEAINPTAVNTQAGYGKAVSASYDDFRIWKTERTGKEIGLNWFKNVHGGTNTDNSKYYFKSSVDNKKLDLAVYFKFNEGIISSVGDGTYDPGNEADSITAIGDNLVLDYSGRINNGVFVGYDPTLNMRKEESAMVVSGRAVSEEKDPLLFIENSDYYSLLNPLLSNGSSYDNSNLTALYNNIPEWIRSEDVKNSSEIKKLLQIIGSYFDTIHAQIEHLRQFREAKYINSSNKTTDYISSLLKAHGFNIPELFVDPDVLSSIYDQDEKGIFEEKLYNLKNKIYKNIYTNLIAIYKSKGTEKGFRNLFRCYGTDDELFKINLYADGVEYQIDDKTYDSLIKKRLVDFSGFRDSNDRTASIFQKTTRFVLGDFGYFPSSSIADIPMSIEAQIVFPNKPEITSLEDLDYLPTASLFGVHSSSLSHSDPTVPVSDCDFQVQTRRDSSKFAQFVLTSSTGFFPTLTSSFFYDEEKQVYDDIPWNLAVRLYPKQFPFSNYVTQSEQFTLNFYGVKNYLGTTFAEFDVSTDITRDKAAQFLTGSNKRFYIGADKVNFTGSVNYKSDVKFARFMVWNSYITNDEITKHARNPKNYGLNNPYQKAFMFESSAISASYIPKVDTLALNWEFDLLQQYNGAADDSTSGSQYDVSKYPIHNFGYYNGQNYVGTLNNFSEDKSSTVLELMQGNIIQRPDSLYGKNMVEIKENDYESFKFNKKPVKMFFAFEASQNEVISRDMLNFFSDVVSYNNLFGETVHEFRQKYKELDHFRSFYFSKVDSVADLEKFVNLYKFLDNALDSVIVNLVPASAATSEKIRTIIEDHTLERHKNSRPYNLLLQNFSEQINLAVATPGVNSKAYTITVENVDENNVDLDQLYFPEPDRTVPIINWRTIKLPTISRDAGTGLGIFGRRAIQRNLHRITERSRINSDPALQIDKFIFSNNSQEKDRGDLLVGVTDVDTFRTQLDIYRISSNAKQDGINYTLNAELNPIYGLEDRNKIQITNNTFSDVDKDGFKLTFTDFAIKKEFVEDISDIDLYGVREMPFNLENRNTGENYSGYEVIPNEIRILSSSIDHYSLLAEKNFEIEFVNHGSNLATIGNKSIGKELFVGLDERKEAFSLGLSVFSPGYPVQIYLTSPQTAVDPLGVFTFNKHKPTNLVKERKTSYVFGPKINYNWSGKTREIIHFGPSERDNLTILNNSNDITYSISMSPFQDPKSGFRVYDRAAISRSIDENDDALYFNVDRGIFRDRTDVETEQLSPNANLNYKNLVAKKALLAAYSTPNTFDNFYYRNIGSEIGKTNHSALPNAHLVVDPKFNQSFIQDYDNAYIIRSSQNNYDQRWVRSSNIVRLSETNNAPYINRVFYSQYSSLIGNLINYAPLTKTNYSSEQIYSIPYDEETVSLTSPVVGTFNVDFSCLNIIVNREINASTRTIDPTSQNYINSKVSPSIAQNKRLHHYLINSNGPYSYALETRRLNYAEQILKSENYRNSVSYTLFDKEDFVEDAVVNFEITPIYSKSRKNTAIIQNSEGLLEINFNIFYPSINDYYDETNFKFIKLPKSFARPILESKHNLIYSTIFDKKSQNLNGFVLKYFDFAEQIFPRAQKLIRLLTNYETETNYLIDENNRKSSQSVNSLGKSFSTTSIFKIHLNSSGFSTWSTETFTIINNGGDITLNDGELMHPNYKNAYSSFSADPFSEDHYNQTFGYRLNIKNRNDSYVPKNNLSPYKNYQIMLDNVDLQTRGIIAEYKSKNNIDSYFDNGCTQISSELSLFGYDYGANSKKLLGLASYSDEVFALKNIHKEIDKFRE